MSDLHHKIKRAAIQRRVLFTARAKNETLADGLLGSDVIESVVYSEHVRKKLRPRGGCIAKRREYVYEVGGKNLDGVWVDSRVKFGWQDDVEVLYVLGIARVEVKAGRSLTGA